MIKRAFDIVFSLAGLALLFPFLAIAALLVKCDSKGPVFFKQERMGKGFRPFWIYKFRTMRQASEGPLLTVGQDPRITRVGSVPAQNQIGRATSTNQCAQRRDELGRSTARSAGVCGVVSTRL